MSIRSAARRIRDGSADTVRGLQLRGGLARLDRALRDGRQPSALLLRQLSRGWGNEAWSAGTALLGATLEWFARSRGPALECGSGITTLALASAASASGRTLLSLEHDAGWAQRVQAALLPTLWSAVTVANAPIRSYGSFDWYSLEEYTLPAAIGFVLCDGPPGSTRGGRYGLAVLGKYLAPGCIVLLDDTQRPGEHSIVQRWCAELGASVIDEASTFTVLRIGAPAAGARSSWDRALPSPGRGGPPGTAARAGVIALVPDRWRGIWTTRHQVLSRLSRFFDVVWVDEARSWSVVWAPGGHRHDDQATQRVAPPAGFVVYDPGRWLPEVYRPRWLREWTRRRRVRNALRILRKKGCRQIILSVWRPQFAWALDAVDADLTCYHIDDEYSFATVDRPNDAAEVALIGRVDQVYVHSMGLLAKKGSINPNTLYMPNGVDYRAFSTPAAEPADLTPIPRPRMGYVGVLKKQLDMSMLLDLARRHPEWSFVGVGPVGSLGDSADIFARLAQLPNVHLLGNRPLATLPGYVQHMDVCLMPYLVNGYTKFINPIKMYEYLAAGRPIVSTPIDSVIPFSDVVRVARSVEEWEAVLLATQGAQDRDGSACAARRARATEYDWDLVTERVADQLRLRLAASLAATAAP